MTTPTPSPPAARLWFDPSWYSRDAHPAVLGWIADADRRRIKRKIVMIEAIRARGTP